MKKKLLRTVCSMLAIIICLSSVPVFAANTTEIATTTSAQATNVDGITETVDSNNRIIRTLEKTPVSDYTISADAVTDGISTAADTEDFTQIKQDLLALGMEQASIDALTDDDLSTYAASSKIVTMVSYSKIDEDNNITYLSEDEALSEVAALQDASAKAALSNVATFQAASATATLSNVSAQVASTATSTATTGEYLDTYMKITYAVLYLGNADYLFSTDARWLTMPNIRGKDLVGSCAMNCTVTNSTRSGYTEYTCKTYQNGQLILTSTAPATRTSLSSFQNASNGNFYGSAANLTLPIDVSVSGTGGIYSNFRAHYQYQGHVTTPTLTTWFNTTGSYIHTTVGLTFTPTLTVDQDGVSGSIGISAVNFRQTRSAELEINYVP